MSSIYDVINAWYDFENFSVSNPVPVVGMEKCIKAFIPGDNFEDIIVEMSQCHFYTILNFVIVVFLL